jgi:phosphonate transport system substrate-binding protein
MALFALSAAGCAKERESAGPKYGAGPKSEGLPVYSLAVHPLYNPNMLFEAYQPLVDYLNARLSGARISLEASSDYASYEAKYKTRKPELLLPNPWESLQAMKAGYSVIAMAGDPKDFKGILIVRKDGSIRIPADLRGKKVSYPSPTALAACIMPQYFLFTHGIDVNRDIENRYVGSQESSIWNVFLGQTVAGATWPPPWRAFQKAHPAEAAELKVAWETESLINNSVMARDDVPLDAREQLRRCLTTIHETDQGKAILAGMQTSRFWPASDKDYEATRAYIDRFERDVREVESE